MIISFVEDEDADDSLYVIVEFDLGDVENGVCGGVDVENVNDETVAGEAFEKLPLCFCDFLFSLVK